MSEAKDYSEWTRHVFGREIPIPGVPIATSLDEHSEFGRRAHDALVQVELAYVDQLLQDVRSRRIPGAFVEFGTYRGWWINHLYERSEALGLNDRIIAGFDSFQGLPEPRREYDGTYWKKGMYAASREEVERAVRALERPRIKLIDGWFSDTLDEPAAAAIKEIAYARIDCDLYEPALQCLRYLSRRLSDGAVLVFDDWPHRIDMGEARAFAEWIPTVPWLRFEFDFFGSWGHFYMRVRHAQAE